MAFLNQRNENHHSVLSTFHIIIASLLLLSVTGLSIITTCPVAFASSFADRSLCFQNTAQEGTETGDALNLTAKAAVLIENNSGRILYEKSKDKELVPASITKIMTLLLIFEALEKGKISLDDPVSVSNYAAQMGGSQVFLEPGETQTVNDMIKCISIASANDAAVAMAELIGGSETSFVKMMNQKAKELGMVHTNFKN